MNIGPNLPGRGRADSSDVEQDPQSQQQASAEAQVPLGAERSSSRHSLASLEHLSSGHQEVDSENVFSAPDFGQAGAEALSLLGAEEQLPIGAEALFPLDAEEQLPLGAEALFPLDAEDQLPLGAEALSLLGAESSSHHFLANFEHSSSGYQAFDPEDFFLDPDFGDNPFSDAYCDNMMFDSVRDFAKDFRRYGSSNSVSDDSAVDTISTLSQYALGILYGSANKRKGNDNGLPGAQYAVGAGAGLPPGGQDSDDSSLEGEYAVGAGAGLPLARQDAVKAGSRFSLARQDAVEADTGVSLARQDAVEASSGPQTGATAQRAVSEQLSTFENLAIGQIFEKEGADFLLGKKGGGFVEFTRELGRISKDLLEGAECFLVGNRGGWRDKEANEGAINKTKELNNLCAQLESKFLNTKDSLDPSSAEFPSESETESILASLRSLSRHVNTLLLKTETRMHEMANFGHQGVTRGRDSYSQIMSDRDIEVAKSYLSRSSFRDSTTLDDKLIEAEKAQQVRDIGTEKLHAMEAYKQLQNLVTNLKKSPKYRIHSFTRKVMRRRNRSEVQRLADRLRSRASLLQRKISFLDNYTSLLKGALMRLKPEFAADMAELKTKCDTEVKNFDEMKLMGFLPEDLSESTSTNQVNQLFAKFKKEEKGLKLADVFLSGSGEVISNTAVLSADGHDQLKSDRLQLSDKLEQRIPTNVVLTEGGKALSEISQKIGGFNEAGFPNNSDAFNATFREVFDENLYLALEKLSVVKEMCENRKVENADLESGFRMLEYPEVKAYMQKLRCASMADSWINIESRAGRIRTPEGMAITPAENASKRKLLTDLTSAMYEEIPSRDALALQQRALNDLRGLLNTVTSRLQKGDCAPSLKASIYDLSIKLDRMQVDTARSIEGVELSEPLQNQFTRGYDEFIRQLNNFESGLRDSQEDMTSLSGS